MNKQQSIAFGSPCRLAEQCDDDKYFEGFRLGRLIVTVGVTLNVGLE